MQIARSASADVQNEMSTLWTLLSDLFYYMPWFELPLKVFIKWPGLSQVLRASVHENQGFSVFFEKVSIKQPVLSQFQISKALNDQVL